MPISYSWTAVHISTIHQCDYIKTSCRG